MVRLHERAYELELDDEHKRERHENTNTSTTPAAAADWAASVKEPDRYSVTMTISGQGQANQRQATLPPQQIQFARNLGDRRWTLNLPAPVGQIIYLEKSGLKYLILPARNQYVELKPEELGFQLGSVLTPSAMVERLKPRAQYEQVGTETINGRPAIKYRFVGAADTKTQAGTVQSDSFVYMDQETGLPLRADLNFSSTSGAVATGTIMTENIQMNPDPTLFEVPTGMRKVRDCGIETAGPELRQHRSALDADGETTDRRGATRRRLPLTRTATLTGPSADLTIS